MRRYESYKDSGVEWMGEVPSHWEISSLGKIFLSVSEKNRPDLPLLSITRELGVIERDTEDQDSNHNFIPDDLSNYKILKKGQFGMNKMKAWQGSYGVSNFTGIVSPAYYIFDFIKSINPQFFHWAIRSKIYVSFFGSASDGVRIGQWDLSKSRMKSIPFIIPSNNEQQKIAQFLDDKTAKIDQNAVTRGLNPDVPLKDSGVEWIGQVPEHWEVKRFRNLFDFGKGLSITKENLQDEGIPCVNYGEIHSKYGFEVIPERDALKCVDSKYLVFKNSMLNKGDFVFADTSEDIEGSGNFTYLNSSTRIFAGYHTVITRLKITAIHRYIAYYFDSLSFRNQIRNEVKGVKVFSITQSILKGTFMLLPNLKEQQQIANYLDTQTAKIDQAIALKTAHIEKLKEYKNVLINDVVTGKVRVSV